MQGKRILLGVTGGIAAYKSPDLVRRLRDRGGEVQVVMTGGAREFVTPTTFQAVSGRTVRSDLWDAAAEAAMGHIELARWADAVLIAPASGALAGRRVLITAGPTRERIDPVRFVSNRSSGKMGFAVAQAAREAGATVVLVAGPVSLPTPAGVARIDVESAADMLAAVLRDLPGTDIFISTAAVADYRPAG